MAQRTCENNLRRLYKKVDLRRPFEIARLGQGDLRIAAIDQFVAADRQDFGAIRLHGNGVKVLDF